MHDSNHAQADQGNMNEKYVFLGSGGHYRSLMDVLHWPEREIVPDTRVASIERLESLIDSGLPFVLAIGQIETPGPRMEVTSSIELLSYGKEVKWPIIQSLRSLVTIGKDRIGKGSQFMHRCFVNFGVRIGDFCIINTGAIVEHDVQIGNFTHIASGAIIAGSATIGSRCFIGAGAVVANNICICDDVVVGCGTTVIQDIDEPGTYVGTPSRRVK